MKKNGTIIKGIGGFYYVDTDTGLIECRARGKFRKDNISPLVGDYVVIEVDELNVQGYIMEIHPRKTELNRPSIANVDQVMIVFAIKKPDINLVMLQKFLVSAEHLSIKPIIVINKIDIDENDEATEIIRIFSDIGYKVISASAKTGEGIDEITSVLSKHITVFAGPSGAGKSTLLNLIKPGLTLKTGDLSKKIDRGTHTTRHVELIDLSCGGKVADTPGFTSLDLNELDIEKLRDCFPEFKEIESNCRFNGCIHINEPDCAVKKAVEEGQIASFRYDFYKQIQEAKKAFRRYK